MSVIVYNICMILILCEGRSFDFTMHILVRIQFTDTRVSRFVILIEHNGKKINNNNDYIVPKLVNEMDNIECNEMK